MDKLEKSFIELLEKDQNEAYVEARKLIDKIYREVPELSQSFKRQIKAKVGKVKNLLMLVYIYSLELSTSIAYDYDVGEAFKQIKAGKERKGSGNTYKNVHEWVIRQQPGLRQEVVEMIIHSLGKIVIKQNKELAYDDKELLIKIFDMMEIKKTAQIQMAKKLIEHLSVSFRDYMAYSAFKETQLINVIVQVASKSQGQGNLGLLFCEKVLGGRREGKGKENIDMYCYTNTQRLIELDEQVILSMLRNLTKCTINFLLLHFIYRYSRVLVEEEEFFKVIHLAQEFIFPELIVRTKLSRHFDIRHMSLKIAEFYGYGLTGRSQFGKTGLHYLLSQCELLQKGENKARWLILSQYVSTNEGLQSEVKAYCKEKEIDFEAETDGYDLLKIIKGYDTWVMNTRNVRKRKVYKNCNSPHKGIKNEGNNCYIISIVQALYMNKGLQAILKKIDIPIYSKKMLKEIKEIFSSLDVNSYIEPQIQDLKRLCDEPFAKSEQQEDAQHYLLSLLGSIENELKQFKCVEEFKKVYEISITRTLTCKKCRNVSEMRQNEYTFTIGHKEKLTLQVQEDIQGYQCEKCKTKLHSQLTKIAPKGEVFIVHINRFSMKGGVAEKELFNIPIVRRILNYELSGIVFHIGKHLNNGHYVYYSKVNAKRWMEMNDNHVVEFDLEKEGEEFERQMKAGKTPYLLFYKKN